MIGALFFISLHPLIDVLPFCTRHTFVDPPLVPGAVPFVASNHVPQKAGILECVVGTVLHGFVECGGTCNVHLRYLCVLACLTDSNLQAW